MNIKSKTLAHQCGLGFAAFSNISRDVSGPSLLIESTDSMCYNRELMCTCIYDTILCTHHMYTRDELLSQCEAVRKKVHEGALLPPDQEQRYLL